MAEKSFKFLYAGELRLLFKFVEREVFPENIFGLLPASLSQINWNFPRSFLSGANVVGLAERRRVASQTQKLGVVGIIVAGFTGSSEAEFDSLAELRLVSSILAKTSIGAGRAEHLACHVDLSIKV